MFKLLMITKSVQRVLATFNQLSSHSMILVQMPTYNVFPIEPPPISPAQLTAYKALRLTSLQIDPHAFSSNYAREVAFTEDAWRERLDSPFKQTLIASVLPDDADEAPAHERDNTDDNGGGVGETGKWIGMASIVGPSAMLPSVLAPFREAGISANRAIYALYGMWVHPAHRGKGVGARLVKACLEWARTHIDPKFSSEDEGDFEKVVVLLVYKDNIAARTLYSGAGFTDLEGISSNEEKWMLAKVEQVHNLRHLG